MTLTSAQLRNTARFGTPLRAESLAQIAGQQDQLLDALQDCVKHLGQANNGSADAQEIAAARGASILILSRHGRHP